MASLFRVLFRFGLAALLLFAAIDCLAEAQVNAQAMDCCGSMPCSPTNKDHDCCRTMVSANPVYLNTAPTPSLYLPAPTVDRVTPVLNLSSFIWAFVHVHTLAPNEHAPPPDLIVLHLSLLI